MKKFRCIAVIACGLCCGLTLNASDSTTSKTQDPAVRGATQNTAQPRTDLKAQKEQEWRDYKEARAAENRAYYATHGGDNGGIADADNCGSAPTVGEGTFPFDTTAATQDATVSCGFNANFDTWLDYVPSGNGTATFSTCNQTSLDTVLAVFSACGGAQLVCLDDFCGLQTQISLAVTAGTHYKVRIAGYNSSRGSGTITITLAGGGGGPANDECTGAIAIGDGTTHLDNTNATTSPNSFCGVTKDLWYSYTASCNGTATATTCLNGGAGIDSIVEVYADCFGTFIGCADDSGCPSAQCGFYGSTVTWNATQGTAYLIRVGGYGNCSGPADLTMSCVSCAGVNCPPGSADEGEPCGSDTNGGCNALPPVYGSLVSGQPVCGTAWASGGTRDTDWYAFCTSGGDITWGGSSEVPLVLFILNSDCANIQLLAQGEVPQCSSGSLTVTLAAGNYVAFAAPGSLAGGVFDGYPCDGSNNDYALTLTYPQCAPGGACCLATGACQDVPDAATCQGLGGVFHQGALCSNFACPAPVNCPPGSSDEGEPCGSDTDGGCNSVPPAYASISPNVPVCGTSWASGGTRDTDWYRFCTTGGDVTWGGSSEVPLVLFILNDDCANIQLLAIGNIPQGGSGSVTVNLAAGSYVAFAAPGTAGGGGIFDGFPCDGVNNDYVLTLSYNNCSPNGACCLPNFAGCQNVADAAACQNLGGVFHQGADCANSPCPTPPPANDECSGAIAICAGTTHFDTTSATNSPDPSPCGAFGADLWYSYTPTSSGAATATTCLNGIAGMDTVLAVYDACGGNLIGCDDDGGGCAGQACGFSGSVVNWNAVANTRYIIRVSGYGGCRGQADLTITGPACGPTCVRGDSNGDGVVNNFDIDPFVFALTHGCGGDPVCICRNDINRDGAVNNFDIDPFVQCLTQGCP